MIAQIFRSGVYHNTHLIVSSIFDSSIFQVFVAESGDTHAVKPISVSVVDIGWRRINRTIQPFNRVHENLHEITPLTLVAHRQIRRQKRNVYLNILR